MAGAGKAVLSKILAHEGAAKALADDRAGRPSRRRIDGTNGDAPKAVDEFRPGPGIPTPR